MADSIETPDSGGAADLAALLAARLLRAVGHEVAQRFAPELTSADARERAMFARLVLDNLAGDVDVLPRVAVARVPALRDDLAAALAPGAPGLTAAERARLADELAAIRPETGTARAREFAGLRDLAARVARRLADSLGEATHPAERAAMQDRLAALGRGDVAGLDAYEAASAAVRGATVATAPTPGEAVAEEPVTAPNLTAYLRRRFAEAPDARATDVTPIPGGRSKKTFFVRVEGGPLAGDLVMRQDFALKYAGTKVADEHGPLVALAGLGLPVPRPLHLEAGTSEVGTPFILVDRLRGSPPGTYFSMTGSRPGAFRELAAVLAKLHAVPPVALGLQPLPPGADGLRTLIEGYQRKWRDNATRASPLVDYAYAWALEQCRRAPGTTAVVHGDAGPYNLLCDGDRLTAVLDWEFLHVGDPAEDLGIARVYAENFMPWPEFVQAYRDAGGAPVADGRVLLGMLIQFLKGTTLVAASGRNYLEGGTNDFIKGANSFTGLRLIERKIADLLKRFGAA